MDLVMNIIEFMNQDKDALQFFVIFGEEVQYPRVTKYTIVDDTLPKLDRIIHWSLRSSSLNDVQLKAAQKSI